VSSPTEPIRKRGEAARQRILDAAEQLFFNKGINATGVEEVADAARVSKRTLYAYFDGKDDLAQAYLSRLRAKPDTVDAAATHPELDPKTRLLRILADGPPGDQPLRGCAFLNAAVEESDPDAPIHQLVIEQKQNFAARISDLARELGVRDPDTLGRRLALLYDGAAAGTTALNSLAPLDTARELAAELIDNALPRTRRKTPRQVTSGRLHRAELREGDTGSGAHPRST
jgi:AcrR family transcriptional regulator